MSNKRKVTPVEKAGTSLAGDIPRFAPMQEIGNPGLKKSNGLVYEDMMRELQFPNCVRIYKQMSYDPTIASALKLYDLMFSASKWKVRAPVGATEEQKKRATFIEQCMGDMEHSWRDFVQETGSVVPYGFAVHEKVYRRRLKARGSKYNDGLIGWGKLAPRSQDTIHKWIWSDDGRDLVGVQQDLTQITDGSVRYGNLMSASGQINIPRSKILLFRTGKRRENPFGESILKSVYLPWKYRCAIEETEAVGIQRDLNGIPVIKIPPQYMSADATPEQKQIYEMYKNIIRNIQVNQQAGLVLPQAFDPDSKQPLFDFSLLSVDGKKAFDVNKVIERYDFKILTTLGADSLLLGSTSTGSYSLASFKQGLINLTVESILQEICDVVNNDLIPQTFMLNGWSDEQLPEIYFDDLTEEDSEQFSKSIQRIASVGLMPRTLPVVNKILSSIGVDDLPPDTKLDDVLTDNTSRAGDGMATAGAGTSTSGSVDAQTNGNMENSA